MPKTRQQKEAHLEELIDTLAAAKGVVFVNYQGTKVKDLAALRTRLHDQAITSRVTKNRILKIALRGQGIQIDETILDQPILMVTSASDEVAPAQVLAAAHKEIESIETVGGLLGAQYLAADEIQRLAKLPSCDQLRAAVVGVLAGPLTGLLRTLEAPMAGLVSVLKQQQQKLI